MPRKEKSNFFTESYDKVVMIVVFVALIVSLILLIHKSGDSRRDADEYEREISALRPRNPKAEAVSDSYFAKTVSRFENPAVMDISENAPRFLIAEERVSCVECGHPIFFNAEVCPACNEKQPADEVGADWDSDGDGMPDKWEESFGLNPADPSDAAMDADGDGFTNLEEFRAGTSPKDSSSHPPRVDYLRVSEVKANLFPYVLKGKTLVAKDKYRYQINSSDGKSFFVGDGEAVGDSGYKIVDSQLDVKEVKVPGIGGTRKVDVITLTLSNGTRTVKIVEGAERVWNEQEVSFVCGKDVTNAVYTAKELETFTFDNVRYRVKSVDKDSGSVVIVDETTQKEITVPKL